MVKRLAIIGCGAIAEAHAGAAQRLDARCAVVACGDADAGRAHAFAQRFAPQAAVFTDIQALLRESAPNAVLLCTPPMTHAALGTACLKHNVALLCEKPLCATSETAHALVSLAAQRAVLLRTSAKFRFVAGVQAARTSIQSGELGALHRLEIAFGATVAVRGHWRADTTQSGGGVLMDNGPHAIDLARFLLGEVGLHSADLRYGTEHGVEEEAYLHLESAMGVPVSIALSWRRGFGEAFLTVTGERGIVCVGWNATVWHRESGSGQAIAPGYCKADAFTHQLAAFLDKVGEQRSTSLQSADKAVQGTETWNRDDGAYAVTIINEAYNARK